MKTIIIGCILYIVATFLDGYFTHHMVTYGYDIEINRLLQVLMHKIGAFSALFLVKGVSTIMVVGAVLYIYSVNEYYKKLANILLYGGATLHGGIAVVSAYFIYQ